MCSERILVKLPLPSGFDQWLSKNDFTVLKDHLPSAEFQWGDVASDKVLCTVQMSGITTVSLLTSYTVQLDSQAQLHSDDFFTDIKAYRLMMYCDIPESSGINVNHLSSPIVMIGYYEGLAADDDAPVWCRRLQPGNIFGFKQPHLDMAELFFKFAKSASKNYALQNAILNWASALYVSSVNASTFDVLLTEKKLSGTQWITARKEKSITSLIPTPKIRTAVNWWRDQGGVRLLVEHQHDLQTVSDQVQPTECIVYFIP